MKKTLSFIASVLVALCVGTSCTVHNKSPVDPNVFVLSELPEIGSFSEKVYEKHFYDEPVYDFLPSDKYGTIVPFSGTYRIFETPKAEGSDWHAEVGYSTYGFCTTDGTIVMDASEKNTYVSYGETDDGFGFYTLTREIQPIDDAPDEYMPNETYVIPYDGSWLIKLSQGAWVSNAGGGYINICDYTDEAANSDVRTRIYDYQGKLVRVVEGFDSTGGFSNGLLPVLHWVSSGYAAYFMNEDGEMVLGPYSSVSDFNENGIAAVKDENGAYLVNVNGERLTEYYDAIYKEYSDGAENHVFSARYKENNKKCDIYSAYAMLLGTVDGTSYSSFRFPDNGRILYYYTQMSDDGKYADSSTERMIWRFLDTGEEFVSSKCGTSPNSYSGTDNCFVSIDKENSKALVFDVNGKTVAEIDGASEVLCTSEYGEYIVYVEGEYSYEYNELTGKPDKDTRKTHIYDSEKGEIVFSVDAYCYAYFADKNERFVELSVYDSENEQALFYEPLYILFDTCDERALFENCRDVSVYDVGENTYISIVTDNSSALYDGKLKLIRKKYFE